jgi:hypothetical protein
MLRHTATFAADGDDGQNYTVLVYEGRTNLVGVTAPELKTLRTVEGENVDRMGQGRYKIMKTGVVLTSGSPNAP